MATAIRFKELTRAFPEGFTWPSREEVDERLRQARRVVKEARNTAEDMAADATRTVRRNPLTAVAMAAGAGMTLGVAFGFVTGFVMKGRRRR